MTSKHLDGDRFSGKSGYTLCGERISKKTSLVGPRAASCYYCKQAWERWADRAQALPGTNVPRANGKIAGMQANGRHNDKALIPVNPGDKDWTKHVFVLWFGAYGATKLMVWANSLDDALDEAVDYIAENLPGLLANEQVEEAYKEAYEAALAGGMDEEEAEEVAREEAETDTTRAGNHGDYILSYEWGIVAEDPTRAQLLELQGREKELRRNSANSATQKDLEEFRDAYLEAALWSSMDEDGEPLDAEWDVDDFSPEAFKESEWDCQRFLRLAGHLLDGNLAQAGHDFWFTRNGHGAGFWDGDWKKHGDKLTEISKQFSEVYIYVGDDEQLYFG